MSTSDEGLLVTVMQRNFVLVSISIIFTLPVVGWLTFDRQITTAYLREFKLPQWEQRFGFRQGTVEVRSGTDKYQAFGFVQVSPGGAFDRYGVKPGDVVVGFVHGFEEGFYSVMTAVDCGEPSDLSLRSSTTGQHRVVMIRPSN